MSSIVNPYATDKELKKADKMMLKKFGPGYKDRGISYSQFDGFNYDSSNAIQDYMKGMSSGDIPRGTTLQVDDAGMPIYVTGENVDYDLMLGRKKFNTTKKCCRSSNARSI